MSSHIARPTIMGRRGVVTSGHYLATEAGLRLLHQGGNAIDAAAAMAFCLHLLEPHQNGIGGECPILVHSARERRTVAISGVGATPAAFTIDWCRAHGIDLIPGDGYLPATVPAPLATWCEALARFGSKTFAEVAQPAIELAEGGFPMHAELSNVIVAQRERFTTLYPSTGEIYLPGGGVPGVGEMIFNRDYGATLRELVDAERSAGGSRVRAIEAVRQAFYTGEIAERIVAFINEHPVADASGAEHAGLLTLDDLAAWRPSVERPVAYRYRGFDVHKCPGWTQGPVFLLQLAILEGLDLASMGHNSPDYLHTVIEAAKLAFADREAYVGDPAFDAFPGEVLLSRAYNDRRRALIGESASREQRPGNVGRGVPGYAARAVLEDNRRALGIANEAAGRDSADPHKRDTTQLDAADAEGNFIAATPSGGWILSSPVVRGLGFPLGTRGQMFFLNPDRPNALAGGKRPRATLTPTLVERDGRPVMAFGTPGGDTQDQTTLQFFLNVADFGMELQAAIDQPSVVSSHFPSSFYPRQAEPARVYAEGRVDPATVATLRRRGHDVVIVDGWSHGRVQCVRQLLESSGERPGTLEAAASPRARIPYAMGW